MCAENTERIKSSPLSKMRLAIISHKVCWNLPDSSSNYQTDGGFPLQIGAVSEMFDETKLLVPCEETKEKAGAIPITGKNLHIRPLSVSKSQGLIRKLGFPWWLIKNGRIIWREIHRADAVHAPIPGDVGTVGMIFALLQRKPLFVRYCGNWAVQTTTAEQFWKWSMEKFAGGRNVMFATGGIDAAPSVRNSNIRWIFSTSLKNSDLEKSTIRRFPSDGKLKLITACRLEERKGVDIVIKSFPLILKTFPQATLDVVGSGSLLNEFKLQTKKLNVGEKVTFHGKVSQPKVVELMKKAHIFCFPTSASEGFPKVVIEALACGLPVVTTKVSVLPQLIGQAGGILLDTATDENLAEAVISICGDAERYTRLSAKAIATARQYSLENWQTLIGENLRRDWNVASLSSVV